MNQTNTPSAANQITEGVIWKQLLLFFFPILFGTFFQQLYNTIDAMIVGRYVGKEALSAVGGITGTLINLLVGFFVGLSSGATVIISQYYGAKRPKHVSLAVHTAIAFCLVGGIALMILGIILAPFALRATGTPAEIIPYAVLYMRIYFIGIIGNLIYNIGSGILRAIGDSKRPLYFLIVSCFVNIVLDLLFVVVFHMGVAGAAWATILSQLVSALLVIYVLTHTKESYRLMLRNIRIAPDMLARIIQIGFPAGLQSVMYSVSNVVIQAGVNGLGTDTVAAWTAYGKLDGLFWMMINAFGISITTFVGQNYGAKKIERVRKGIRTCLVMAFAASIFLSTFLYIAGGLILHLFTTDLVVWQIGLNILHFLVPTFFTYVCIEILSGALRGTGDCWVPMAMTCVGVCVLRVIWIIFVAPLRPDIFTVSFCYPLTWTITSLLFIIYYKFFSHLRKTI
ncbi:MAG: MATE family efflux transporter [Lachnospiraceae bacterium]|nr:MATE family efflux transporter [Lachnospiraceae bacterium]